jgi:hypothetical protein
MLHLTGRRPIRLFLAVIAAAGSIATATATAASAATDGVQVRALAEVGQRVSYMAVCGYNQSSRYVCTPTQHVYRDPYAPTLLVQAFWPNWWFKGGNISTVYAWKARSTTPYVEPCWTPTSFAYDSVNYAAW